MIKGSRTTVVIDTNLFISGIISKENTTPQQLLNAWRSHKFSLCISDSLISELALVLNRERIYKTYNISPEDIAEFLRELRDSTVFVTPLDMENLPLHSRDKKDDKILSCAIGGSCDYLITGDDDLLVLNGKPELGPLQIIKAAEFLQRMG